MAVSIDYSTFVITVPRADMTLVQSSPIEIRELDLDWFRTALNGLMDDPEGIPFPTNHAHTPPLAVAGITLARVVEILSPYTVTFEDGAYNVNVTNGNSNLADVTNKNQVGVNTANSAGLVQVDAQLAATEIAAAVWDRAVALHQLVGSFGELEQKTFISADRAGSQRLTGG